MNKLKEISEEMQWFGDVKIMDIELLYSTLDKYNNKIHTNTPYILVTFSAWWLDQIMAVLSTLQEELGMAFALIGAPIDADITERIQVQAQLL